MNETMGMSYASLYYAEVGKNNELQKENKKLKELCDKYEEEHNTTFEEWKKDIKANKKARIYIKEHSTTIDYKTMKADYNLNMNDLLNILQGEQNE